MKHLISSVIVTGVTALILTGCADKVETIKPAAQTQPQEANFSCKQENVLAPKWTCIPMVDGFYAGLGVAKKTAAGMGMMRKIALANGRSDLAQQIKSQVKDKVETFTRVTGNGDSETIDQVSTAVSKQLAKVDLQGSKTVDVWNAPSGDLYMLVTVPQSTINKEVKESVSTSFKNDDALWQQFQSKNALEALDKEFPAE